MKKPNLRHVGIVVSNMEQSLVFYRDLLGFSIIKDQIERGKYIDIFLGLKNVKVRTVKMSLAGGSMLELLHFESHKKNNIPSGLCDLGCTHIALTVENLQETYSKLLEHDVSFVNEPEMSPDGNAKVCFCKDPDGTYLELVEEVR